MTENQKLREALQAISHIDDTTNHSVDASAALDRIGQIARQALALPTKAEPAAQEAAPKPNLIESDDPFAELITASPQPPPALRARPWSAGGEDWVRWSDYCVMMGLRDSALSAQAVPDERGKVDAERYRLIRRGQHFSIINGIGDMLRGENLDAAIDAAMRKDKP